MNESSFPNHVRNRDIMQKSEIQNQFYELQKQTKKLVRVY